MDPIKVGFIGAGDISNLHAEGVINCPDAEMHGLWNRTRSRAEDKAEKFDCKVYDTPEELCADPDIGCDQLVNPLYTQIDRAGSPG